jgi:alpha-mannosidase
VLHAEQSRRRFEQTASRLRSLAHAARTPATAIEVSEEAGRVGWEAAQELRYREARLGEEFGPLWATYWFRVELTPREEWDGGPVHLVWDSGCEATLWRDGLPAQGLNAGGQATRKTAPLGEASPGKPFAVAVEMACNPWTGQPLAPIEGLEEPQIGSRRRGSAWTEGASPAIGPSPARLREVALALFDPTAWDLYWDFEVLRRLEAEHDRGLDPHHDGILFAALERFCNEWDAEEGSTWGSAAEILREPLAETGPARNHRVFAVGHTHLDTAWLWPMAETRRKFVRSVANQLGLMDRYPEHRFSASAAQHYEWLKEDAPELFERVRERVKEGRWSGIGGSWVECDCNMPSGESLVRQYLYGQRWFQRELGVRCREHWGPDTFGHPGSLPQILRACGIDRFVTQKLSWNQFTDPLHDSFVWEGIDGSTVLAHMPPSDTCNAMMTVREIRESIACFRDADRSEVSLMMFGHGDGGGGPDPEMLETAKRIRDLRGMPRVEPASSEEFFDALEDDEDRLGRIAGELYLEFHRGTYTSQLRTKQGNRRGEEALGEAEAAAALATRVAGAKYPRKRLERLWRTLLCLQFHDILPGTSIAEVHRDAERLHAELRDDAAAIRDAALAELAPAERSFANLTPFARREVVGDVGSGLGLVSAPAYGFGGAVEASDAVSVREEGELIVMRNEALTATLDAGGRLVSLLEGASGREALAAPGNVFELYEDRPTQYDAWELEPYHSETRRVCDGAIAVEVVTGGPLRGEVRFTHEVGAGSVIVQVVRLDAHARRLEFRTTLDWRERHRILKVAFPAAVQATTVTYETAFGVHERSTSAGTLHDYARFEVPAHRFADVGETGFGVAVLTDSTYGYSCRGAELRLSLLRAPTDPDPGADQGEHELAYALVSHSGSWQEAGVVREARAFNQPLRPIAPGAGAGGGFACVESGELVLDAIKRAEDGDALVLRLYEPHGGGGTSRIRLGFPFESVQRANALEEPLDDGEAHVEGGAVTLAYRPFELVTLLVD